MTSEAFHNDFKICPVCDIKFFRKRGGRETAQVWDARLTCSRPCAYKHIATRASRWAASMPRPEPTFRDVVPDWRNYAACLGEDPELFWPVGNSGPALLQINEAKTVCGRCSVEAECLTWALESGQDSGVWGGMSEDERRALKRRNTRTRARTA